ISPILHPAGGADAAPHPTDRLRERYDVSMHRLLLPVLSLLALVPFAAQLSAQQNRSEMVAMRDGVKLDTNIYLPEGSGPWPVVLTRTPYGKDQMYAAKNEAAYMQAGYVRVVQDVRGRFKSEGKYRPFADDLEDGYDTIEWIAK